jgi:hypothetical protein
LAAELQTACRWPDIDAFHFTGCGINTAQRGTANNGVTLARQQQTALRGGVLAGKFSELSLVPLKAQADAGAVHVLTENGDNGLVIIRETCRKYAWHGANF